MGVGIILSMSSSASVYFLDVGMDQWIQKPPKEAMDAEEANVFEYLRQAYAKAGTKDWPFKTAEWFLVRLMTKVLVVPHGRHEGRTIPEIQKAYLPLLRDLVCL